MASEILNHLTARAIAPCDNHRLQHEARQQVNPESFEYPFHPGPPDSSKDFSRKSLYYVDRPTSACRDSFLVTSLVFQVRVVNDCLYAADRQEGVVHLSLERAGGTLAAP